MKRITATSVALVAALTMSTAPANAVPVGPLTVTTSSLSISTTTSCAEVPIAWYLTSAPSDTHTWTVSGDIVDSAGASRGSVFEYESLPVSQAGSTYDLCGLPEGTTTFTVAADVDAWSSSFESSYSTRFTGTLTVTRTTPPPPPPVTINTQLVVDGRPIWFERRTHARIGALVEFRACAMSRDVVLTGKKSTGGWRKIARWTVDNSAYLRARVPYSFRKVRFETPVAQTPGLTCTADTTLPVRVPRKS